MGLPVALLVLVFVAACPEPQTERANERSTPEGSAAGSSVERPQASSRPSAARGKSAEFEELCKIATEIDADTKLDPQQKFDALHARGMKELPGQEPGGAKEAIAAVSMPGINPVERYRMVTEAAREAGSPSFSCESLRRLLAGADGASTFPKMPPPPPP